MVVRRAVVMMPVVMMVMMMVMTVMRCGRRFLVLGLGRSPGKETER